MSDGFSPRSDGMGMSLPKSSLPKTVDIFTPSGKITISVQCWAAFCEAAEQNERSAKELLKDLIKQTVEYTIGEDLE